MKPPTGVRKFGSKTDARKLSGDIFCAVIKRVNAGRDIFTSLRYGLCC